MKNIKLWINVIERKYGIKIKNYKYATRNNYIVYLFGMDGEIIGIWDTKEGFPYEIIEVRLLDNDYKLKEIIGEELA